MMTEEERAEQLERVKATWDEVGFRIRPLRWMVMVRTEPMAVKTDSGALYLPPRMARFHGVLPHMHLVKAVICSAGPIAKKKWQLREGDRILFKRLHFAWFRRLLDGTRLGWLSAVEVLGYPYDDAEENRKQREDFAQAAGYGF